MEWNKNVPTCAAVIDKPRETSSERKEEPFEQLQPESML